ncbi:hypothetical protein [Candidatus Nitrosocosmicus sp. SS]|jgi:hypothetical protein|uniref:hypothetical protein n=1 Tax=Candidatus Nitrosocosmicus agrestis TaxID=2563600 RepID=UPI00122E4AAF|nr:hypothetical protein [Candidatus Nitrosocosmicus sp. SS]KAA2282182.1 hypothetical protein F1Z66_07055 [Candidatus Nitrosocosmicus sp. SS]KAF0869972.1 hypothetical protein E5N71_01755 [Candidatus Nitrosocosmicus sp. SS]
MDNLVYYDDDNEEKVIYKVYSSGVNYNRKSITITRYKIEQLRWLKTYTNYTHIPKDQPILTRDLIDLYLKDYLHEYRSTVNHDRKTIRIFGLKQYGFGSVSIW